VFSNSFLLECFFFIFFEKVLEFYFIIFFLEKVLEFYLSTLFIYKFLRVMCLTHILLHILYCLN